MRCFPAAFRSYSPDAARLCDRQALKLRHRIEPVLRRLDRNVVAHAVSWIEIETGAGLEATAQRHQEALRYILLRKANGLCAGTIHIHGEVWIIKRLLNAGVGSAGYVAYVIRHFLCNRAVAIQIGSDDLDIDWRRKAKIENLRNDVDWKT